MKQLFRFLALICFNKTIIFIWRDLWMKSKTWSLFLSLVIMALMLPALQLRTRAKEFVFNGLKYEYVDDSSVCVVGYVEIGEEEFYERLVIPQEIEFNGRTYTVSAIKSRAFYGCRGLEQVMVPNSVKKIGKEALFVNDDLRLIFAPNSNLMEVDDIFKDDLTCVYVLKNDYEGLYDSFKWDDMVKCSLSAKSDNGSDITLWYVSENGKLMEDAALKLVEHINLYYDGSPKEVTLEGIKEFKTVAGCKEDLKVDYYKNGTLSKLTSAPVEPGKYDAVVTYGGVRASVTFEIRHGIVVGDTLNKGSDEINQDENGEIITPETKEGLPEDTIEVEQEGVNTTIDQGTDNFKTGDTNNITFLITLMFLSLALGSLTVRKRKFEK